MNNSLGFLLAYKSAEGLPKNKRLLYGILGAQAPAGDLSQTIVPILLAKREVKNQPQPTPSPPSKGDLSQIPEEAPKVPEDKLPKAPEEATKVPEELTKPITLEQLEEFVTKFKQQEQEKEEQEKEQERIKAMYDCLESCLDTIKEREKPAEEKSESAKEHISPQ